MQDWEAGCTLQFGKFIAHTHSLSRFDVFRLGLTSTGQQDRRLMNLDEKDRNEPFERSGEECAISTTLDLAHEIWMMFERIESQPCF